MCIDGIIERMDILDSDLTLLELVFCYMSIFFTQIIFNDILTKTYYSLS